MDRHKNVCQPQEYTAEMFSEYFESAKARALKASAIEAIIGDDYDLDRLRELVEADRDGRCVLLPCKVGDRIYKLFCGDVIELEVERIVRWSSGFWKLNANTNKTLTDWKGFEIDFADFGKTVFLTSEAAEAALKGESDETQTDISR